MGGVQFIMNHLIHKIHKPKFVLFAVFAALFLDWVSFLSHDKVSYWRHPSILTVTL